MSPPHQRRSPARRRRRVQWIFLLAVVLVGFRALLPPALGWGTEFFASRATGRVVELDNVDLALYRGGVRAVGLRIGGPLPEQGDWPPIARSEAIVSVGSAAAELDWLALLHGEVRLRSVDIVVPEARFERAADGTLTALVLVPPEPEAQAEDEGSGPGWPLLLDRLRLQDLALILRNPEHAEVDFRLAEFSLGDFSLRDGQVALGEIDLREPQLRVRRELATGERPVRAAGAAKAAEPSGAEPAGASGPGPRIRQIEIDRAAFTLLTDDAPLDVVLGFSASDVNLDPGESFPATLWIELAGGALEVAGEVGAAPPRFEGRVEWNDIGLPVVTRSLGLELPIRVDSVVSSGELDVLADLGDGEAGRVKLVGTVEVRELDAIVKATDEHLLVGSLGVRLDEFEMTLPGGPGPQAPARFQGGLEAEGIRFESPASEVVARVASIAAKEVAANVPVSPAPDVLSLSGAFRGDGVEAEVGTGDRVRVDKVQVTLRELGAPTGEGTGQAFEVAAGGSFSGIEFESPQAGIAAQVAGLALTQAAATLPVSGAPEIVIDAVELDRPQLVVTRQAPPGGPTGKAEPTPSAQEGATLEPRARLARFELRNGSVQLVDEVVQPASRSRVEGIHLSARDVVWPERRVGRFDLRSRGPAGAALKASGALGASSRIELALDSLGLSHFNPYAEPSGYRISRGSAGLHGDVSLAGDEVEVDTRLVLDQLDLESGGGEEFEAEFGMPVGLAVALLQDPSGRIALPIGFTSDRDELNTKIVPLVLATLRHALVGAVTLPFKAIKGLAPSDDGDLSLPRVAAAPGQIGPTPEAVAEVAAMAQLLADRPQLGLRISGHAGPEDREPLARELLTEQVRAGEPLPESVELGFFARRRLRSAVEKNGSGASAELDEEDRALLDQVIAAVAVPEERTRALAQARAAALREMLVTEYGVVPNRIQLVETGFTDAPGAIPELVAASALPPAEVAESEVSPPPVATGPPDPGVGGEAQ